MRDSKLAAVINVGSIFIRMVIAEFPFGKEMRVIEQVSQFIGLGREVYTSGFIRKKTILQAIQIFLQFKELLSAYNLAPADVRVIGTAALREARNKDNFIDRIEIRTNFSLQVIDGIEENRLSYMAMRYAMKDLWPQLSKHNSMIAEVGAGSTEIILLRRGMICAVHSFSFGTIRLEAYYKGSQGTSLSPQTLQQSMLTTKEILDDELKLNTIKYFIAVGNYARLAAEISESSDSERYWRITKAQWWQLTHLIQQLTIEEIVRRYGVSATAVDGFANALLAFFYLLEETDVEEVFIPKVGYSEGLLAELGPKVDQSIQEHFLIQIKASALSLGKKYHFDIDHARYVTGLALEIFDTMKKDHHLNDHAKLLLEIAALLHDIGTYIKPSGHHKHSQYLIENSELFGINAFDTIIIGNIARYHRKTHPLPSHASYINLPRQPRLLVLKLAAILRVADALDKGHSQKLSNLRFERRDEELRIKADYTMEISAERLGLAEKSILFEEVFGLKVILT